jgi:four helix bundle protein
MFNFEKLDVWREAIAFAEDVYAITRSFPDSERFGLVNQMRRAAVSVSSNIAEGCSRSSPADYSRFLEIAAGSVFEVVSQAEIARLQGFADDDARQTLYRRGDKIVRMLSGLRRTLTKASTR